MQIHTKRLLKNSAVYSFFTVLQKAFGFFLLPLYTTYISVDEYGIVGVVNSISSVLVIIYGLGLRNASARFYYLYKKQEPETIRVLWGNILVIQLVTSGLLTGIVILLHRWILLPMLDTIDFHPYMTFGLVTALFQPTFLIYQSILRAKQLSKPTAINDFLYFLINTVTIVILITLFDFRAEGILLGPAITGIIFFFYSLIMLWREVEFKVRWVKMKQVLAYSLPLLPHNLSTWAMTMIDRVFLNIFLSVKMVSLYNVAFQIASITNYISMAFVQAYGPWFFEQINLGEKGKERIIASASAGVISFSAIGVFFSIFSKEILDVMVPDSYLDGYKVVPTLTFAFVFHTVYFFVAGPLFVNNTRIFALVSLLGATINIGLNWLLIPEYGIQGAATASLIQKAVLSTVFAFIGYKYEKLNFQWALLYTVPTFAFIISLAVNFLVFDNALISWSIKLSISAIIFWAIFLKYKKEINSIIKFKKKY